MSDTTPFGFGKFVPGFDFLQNLAKGASGNMAQMPNLSSWIAPTISIEDLDKRVQELKAVQFWLEQNSRALSATIQALEVQKMTLATLQGMNVSMGDVAKAFQFKTGDSVMGGAHKPTDTMGSAAQAMASAAARMAGRATAAPESAQDPRAEPAPESASQDAKGSAKTKATDAAEPGMVDPMQWWGALTSQFQQIASTAMKDAAKQAAVDTPQNMATGLAKDALKTATDMASQFAAKGMETMQRSASAVHKTRTASAPASPASTATKKAAVKKTATRPAAKAAQKAAPRKTPARKPASRKSAG